MPSSSFLAFDLGAASGRTILGHFNGGRLVLEEITRFPNKMIPVRGHLHWNVLGLFDELKEGMKSCLNRRSGVPETLGIASWGVDFGFLARDGSLLSMPFAYRDKRNCGVMEEFFEIIPRVRVYELTGNQFLQFNSLFQLYALRKEGWPLLDSASDLLFMPDLFNYLLTGEKRTEFTYATTSQLFNPLQNKWEKELIQAAGIPASFFQKIIPPGEMIGRLEASLSEETGFPAIPVVSVASHDTGSAVAAVPSEGKEWAFISSGTWSCMGIESPEPIISEKALALNFTNEGGVEGTFRVLKNITGLWLLQECRRIWTQEKRLSFQDLTAAAQMSPPFSAFIDPDWTGFLNPPDMTEAISQFCLKTDQKVPETPGVFVRIILESLALKYRFVLDQLMELSPYPVRCIYVIGGGSKNRFLSQLTANATGLPVISGPSEATAVGNILMQCKSQGYIGSHDEMRAIIRRSFALETYHPADGLRWADAYSCFLKMIQRLREN